MQNGILSARKFDPTKNSGIPADKNVKILHES